MSLITAHKILITAAIIFFCGFSWWEFNHYWTTQNPWAGLRASLYVLVAIGFLIYLRSLRRWIK